VLYGVAVGQWPVAATGAGVVVAVIVWHAAVLVRTARRALPGPFGHVIPWYVAAAGALATGGALGGLLAAQVGSASLHERLHAGHAMGSIQLALDSISALLSDSW
jgi:nitrite reductase (NO-forming)